MREHLGGVFTTRRSTNPRLPYGRMVQDMIRLPVLYRGAFITLLSILNINRRHVMRLMEFSLVEILRLFSGELQFVGSVCAEKCLIRVYGSVLLEKKFHLPRA